MGNLHIRFAYLASASLGVSIERLSDGFFYNFASTTFESNPSTVNRIAALTAGVAPYLGFYTLNLTTNIGQFTDGNYALYVHNTATSNTGVTVLGATMSGGDDLWSKVVLHSTGVDSVMVESGVNLRQAATAILSVLAGDLTGAGTGAITIRGGNTPTIRVEATVDEVGNRDVTLSLPA